MLSRPQGLLRVHMLLVSVLSKLIPWMLSRKRDRKALRRWIRKRKKLWRRSHRFSLVIYIYFSFQILWWCCACVRKCASHFPEVMSSHQALNLHYSCLVLRSRRVITVHFFMSSWLRRLLPCVQSQGWLSEWLCLLAVSSGGFEQLQIHGFFSSCLGCYLPCGPFIPQPPGRLSSFFTGAATWQLPGLCHLNRQPVLLLAADPFPLFWLFLHLARPVLRLSCAVVDILVLYSWIPAIPTLLLGAFLHRECLSLPFQSL